MDALAVVLRWCNRDPDLSSKVSPGLVTAIIKNHLKSLYRAVGTVTLLFSASRFQCSAPASACGCVLRHCSQQHLRCST